MSFDIEKKVNYAKRTINNYTAIFKPVNPEESENIAEYLRTVRLNMERPFYKYAFPLIVIFGVISIAYLVSSIYSFKLPNRELLFRIAISLASIIGILYLFLYHTHFKTYRKYQEVECPKCREYIPFYRWQCPKCETVHKERHIFLNCNGCDMKVGKLHKNLQSIKCLNENCGYDLYLYKPYEGGFNEHSFRGE